MLQNKAPTWNEHLAAYCLNFNGRVTLASVKNFQLVEPRDQDTVLLQFGKACLSNTARVLCIVAEYVARACGACTYKRYLLNTFCRPCSECMRVSSLLC